MGVLMINARRIHPVLMQGTEAKGDIFGSQSPTLRSEDQERSVPAGGCYWVRTGEISLATRSERILGKALYRL